MDSTQFLEDIKARFEELQYLMQTYLFEADDIKRINVEVINTHIADLYDAGITLQKFLEMKKEQELKKMLDHSDTNNVDVKDQSTILETDHKELEPTKAEEQTEGIDEIVSEQVEEVTEPQIEIKADQKLEEENVSEPEPKESDEEKKDVEEIKEEEPGIEQEVPFEEQHATVEEQVTNETEAEISAEEVSQNVEEKVVEKEIPEIEKEEEISKEKDAVVQEKVPAPKEESKPVITEDLLEQSISQKGRKETKKAKPELATLFDTQDDNEEDKIDLPIYEKKEQKSLEFGPAKAEMEAPKVADKKTVIEKFEKQKPSLLDNHAAKPGTIADRVQKSPIADIRSAINLNMKLSFIKDLYKGDQKEYKQMIDFLSKCKNYTEAKLFIQNEKDKHSYWAEKPKLVDTLMDLIERRFLS